MNLTLLIRIKIKIPKKKVIFEKGRDLNQKMESFQIFGF